MRRELRRTTWLWLVAVLALSAGCGAPSKPVEKPATTDFSGTELKVAIEPRTVLADVLPPRIADWEARTKGKVTLVAASSADIDLTIATGEGLVAYPTLVPFSAAQLKDPRLGQSSLPAVYRGSLGRRHDQVVALPLAGDAVLLWLRGDVFDNPALREKFRKETGQNLREPETWVDYERIARFLAARPESPLGATEPSAADDATARIFLARAAALAKGPNWSTFAINTENGTPRLAAPPFVRALVAMKTIRSLSQAEKPLTGAEAARAFLSGKAAMTLATPATIAAAAEGKIPADLLAAPLPASDVVFDPRGETETRPSKPNGCAHLAGTGVFVAVVRESDAARDLAISLADATQVDSLLPASRRGFLPIQPALLREPGLWAGTTWSAATATKLFSAASDAFGRDNWVADLRVPGASELNQVLASEIALALAGKKEPQKALNDANAAWTKIIDRDRKAFLATLRDSLALPPITP